MKTRDYDYDICHAEMQYNAVNVIDLTKLQKHDYDIYFGYGVCAVSGCPYKGFKDSYGSDLCDNCGHKYTDHY